MFFPSFKIWYVVENKHTYKIDTQGKQEFEKLFLFFLTGKKRDG